MPDIHPTAIIDERAELADDVRVGPGCIIEGPVTLGLGTVLLHRVSLRGPLTVGSNNTFYPNTCIGFPPQHRAIAPDAAAVGVTIGDDNVFREGVSIHTATKDQPTTIGNRNYLMANSHVGHDTIVGDDVTMANGVLLAGHVTIGDNVFIGGNAGVHQFCRVGRFGMLAGVMMVTQDLPPFCTVYNSRQVGSLNIVGLRRAGYRNHLRALKRAFALLYFEKHTLSRAASLIEDELGHDALCRELAAFVRDSKRGISPYGGNRDSQAELV